ncbi:hypothetical protein QT651_22505, partial [Xanthomonas citri pv. citri]
MNDHDTDHLDSRDDAARPGSPHRSRTRRVAWGVTAVAGGAMAGAILAGGLPAFASNSTPS